ncbi:5'-3' exoribonuclease 2 [Irineochytrium annulatum]|nr:5'-3' exoribonuclease 2 [Irineochytrium annulatum]
MGVPALFRWLSTKYPKVTSQVVEELPRNVNGQVVPVDMTAPNPNGVEFDNLYLDMNGIIHPCCHPEDKPAPSTEDEMMVEIFKYIDRILGMIRPRKVLYMAIEAYEKAMEEEKIRKEWEARGEKLPEKEQKETFDSNCITPGTPFMANLAVALRYYISDRLNSDPAWRNVKVLLSDASVPGEGEHKIMDYIRRQRSCPEYDPNTSHVLYGLDADLIMLALATHEPHFKILREDVFANQNNNKGCFICGQTDHQAAACTGKKKEKTGQYDEKGTYVEKPFVFLHVSVLREYLEAELKEENLPFAWDVDRAIDDWVFLCFFVGNDFLPHLPSLEIREGAIDRLIELWRKNLFQWGGYLTDSGDIDLHRVQLLLMDLGQVEDEIFMKRRQDENRKRENAKRRKAERKMIDARMKERDERKRMPRADYQDSMAALPTWTPQDRASLNKANDYEQKGSSIYDANKAAAEALRLSLGGASSPMSVVTTADQAGTATAPVAVPAKRKADDITPDDEPEPSTVVETIVAAPEEDEPEDDELVIDTMTVADVPIPMKIEPKKDEDSDAEPEDNIRLWETGWKTRYYEKKFHVETSNKEFIRDVVTKYVEGFCWVLKYYYQGVQSWQWYFPYHYAPFAADFDFIGELNITFNLGQPFKPIEQLMGVLPAASRMHIPSVFHPLMTNDDSPIIDFYPLTFPIDLNGKKYAWQGVALLPFIEEERLFKAMEPLYGGLTDAEVARNTLGNEVIFVGKSSTLFESLCALYGKRISNDEILLNAKESDRMLGSVLPDPQVCIPGLTFESPLASQGLPDLPDNNAISAVYIMPQMPLGYIFPSRTLSTVKFPSKLLNGEDVYWVRMGGKPSRGGRGRGRGGHYRGGAPGRMIKNNTPSSVGADGLPYMGGGGYMNNSQNGYGNYAPYPGSAQSYNGGSDIEITAGKMVGIGMVGIAMVGIAVGIVIDQISSGNERRWPRGEHCSAIPASPASLDGMEPQSRNFQHFERATAFGKGSVKSLHDKNVRGFVRRGLLKGIKLRLQKNLIEKMSFSVLQPLPELIKRAAKVNEANAPVDLLPESVSVIVPVASNMELDPEVAKSLFANGSFFILLDAPTNLEFGFDYNEWRTGPRFKGVKFIPPGLHFIYYGAGNTEGGVAARTGLFKFFEPREIVVRKWDAANEDLHDDVMDQDELARFRQNIRQLDSFLGAYPLIPTSEQPVKTYQRWLALTSFVSKEVVRRVLPSSGKVSSMTSISRFSDVTATVPAGPAIQEMDVDEGASSQSTAGVASTDLRINFTYVDLKRSFGGGATPFEVTKYSLDKSFLLLKVLKEQYQNDYKLLLGEIQLAFVMFLIGQIYDGLEQWKCLCLLVCGSNEALREQGPLFIDFIGLLEGQLAACPEDFFMDAISSGSFLSSALVQLVSNIRESGFKINDPLLERAEEIKSFLRQRFKWDLDVAMEEAEGEDEEPSGDDHVTSMDRGTQSAKGVEADFERQAEARAVAAKASADALIVQQLKARREEDAKEQQRLEQLEEEAAKREDAEEVPTQEEVVAPVVDAAARRASMAIPAMLNAHPVITGLGEALRIMSPGLDLPSGPKWPEPSSANHPKNGKGFKSSSGGGSLKGVINAIVRPAIHGKKYGTAGTGDINTIRMLYRKLLLTIDDYDTVTLSDANERAKDMLESYRTSIEMVETLTRRRVITEYEKRINHTECNSKINRLSKEYKIMKEETMRTIKVNEELQVEVEELRRYKSNAEAEAKILLSDVAKRRIVCTALRRRLKAATERADEAERAAVALEADFAVQAASFGHRAHRPSMQWRPREASIVPSEGRASVISRRRRGSIFLKPGKTLGSGDEMGEDAGVSQSECEGEGMGRSVTPLGTGRAATPSERKRRKSCAPSNGGHSSPEASGTDAAATSEDDDDDLYDGVNDEEWEEWCKGHDLMRPNWNISVKTKAAADPMSIVHIGNSPSAGVAEAVGMVADVLQSGGAAQVAADSGAAAAVTYGDDNVHAKEETLCRKNEFMEKVHHKCRREIKSLRKMLQHEKKSRRETVKATVDRGLNMASLIQTLEESLPEIFRDKIRRKSIGERVFEEPLAEETPSADQWIKQIVNSIRGFILEHTNAPDNFHRQPTPAPEKDSEKRQPRVNKLASAEARLLETVAHVKLQDQKRQLGAFTRPSTTPLPPPEPLTHFVEPLPRSRQSSVQSTTSSCSRAAPSSTAKPPRPWSAPVRMKREKAALVNIGEGIEIEPRAPSGRSRQSSADATTRDVVHLTLTPSSRPFKSRPQSAPLRRVQLAVVSEGQIRTRPSTRLSMVKRGDEREPKRPATPNVINLTLNC